uniref:Uncharacterized protein n=1 Tax=Haptolina brevifila TaxID=156173 RepID=A0A7S2FX03_9EUKA|mmetsp:Transcript_2136/g.4343  ORF Transcript_2136/g.4343 Transcript_2136/m.4343 type:complete len:125 (+) Transcript_2136:43-417(+)
MRTAANQNESVDNVLGAAERSDVAQLRALVTSLSQRVALLEGAAGWGASSDSIEVDVVGEPSESPAYYSVEQLSNLYSWCIDRSLQSPWLAPLEAFVVCAALSGCQLLYAFGVYDVVRKRIESQ